MSNSANSHEWFALFARGPRSKQQRFIAVFAYELTVLARGHFEEKEHDRARRCNETVHRLMAFLMTLLDEAAHADSESFFEMIRAGAEANGWGQILATSMRRASIPSDNQVPP